MNRAPEINGDQSSVLDSLDAGKLLLFKVPLERLLGTNTRVERGTSYAYFIGRLVHWEGEKARMAMIPAETRYTDEHPKGVLGGKGWTLSVEELMDIHPSVIKNTEGKGMGDVVAVYRRRIREQLEQRQPRKNPQRRRQQAA